MTKALKTLKALPKKGVAVDVQSQPPMGELPHKRLARLTAEQERLTMEIQEHRAAWAARNIEAQRLRQPPSTAEQTAYKQHHRDLSCALAEVSRQIGEVGAEIRAHKEIAARKAKPADQVVVQPMIVRTNGVREHVKKQGPVKEHPAFPEYVVLAVMNELEPGLRDLVLRSAKSMLSQALATGIEQ